MELRVREFREKNKLSQQELSRRSGVKQPVISDIESGKIINPQINTVAALAEALGVNLDDIIVR